MWVKTCLQRTLHDFAHGEAHTIERSMPQPIRYCVNCVLDLNDSDANRFETRMFKKKIRVVLKPGPTANMLVCPRCGAQHFTSDFYRGRNKGYKHP